MHNTDSTSLFILSLKCRLISILLERQSKALNAAGLCCCVFLFMLLRKGFSLLQDKTQPGQSDKHINITMTLVCSNKNRHMQKGIVCCLNLWWRRCKQNLLLTLMLPSFNGSMVKIVQNNVTGIHVVDKCSCEPQKTQQRCNQKGMHWECQSETVSQFVFNSQVPLLTPFPHQKNWLSSISAWGSLDWRDHHPVNHIMLTTKQQQTTSQSHKRKEIPLFSFRGPLHWHKKAVCTQEPSILPYITIAIKFPRLFLEVGQSADAIEPWSRVDSAQSRPACWSIQIVNTELPADLEGTKTSQEPASRLAYIFSAFYYPDSSSGNSHVCPMRDKQLRIWPIKLGDERWSGIQCGFLWLRRKKVRGGKISRRGSLEQESQTAISGVKSLFLILFQFTQPFFLERKFFYRIHIAVVWRLTSS